MIVTIASAWNASAGGINAFNIELTRALARVSGRRVCCAVTTVSDEDRLSARSDGVILVAIDSGVDGKPTDGAGSQAFQALHGSHAADVCLWIGHDLVSGTAASVAAASHGGRLALIHHMDYASYQNFRGDRGDEAVANSRLQMRLLGNPQATLFGVGRWLADNAARLGGRDAHVIIPGFPAFRGVNTRDRTDRLQVLTAGRFNVGTEPLKRIGTAIDGFALAVREGRDLALLERPTMIVLGTSGSDLQTMLHARATDVAGRPVNVVPAGFDDDPAAFAELASRAHLVVVPSRHEGFGLVGWEAIGTGTPLIIGSGAGLAHQLRMSLDGREQGLASILDLDGSDEDAGRIALAIRKVAADLPGALRRAESLRRHLAAEHACDWSTAATDLLAKVGLAEAAGRHDPSSSLQPSPTFRETGTNHVERCVELGVTAVQGSTRRSVELVAELRFGTTEIEIDNGNIEAEIALEKVTLEVRPRSGRLRRADRLGEGRRPVPGVRAKAGGVWLIEAADGRMLDAKVLGDDSLCVVESTGEHPAIVDVEVTVARRHIHCEIRSKRKLSGTAKKVMGVFLKECVRKPVSGHSVLSTAVVSEEEA